MLKEEQQKRVETTGGKEMTNNEFIESFFDCQDHNGLWDISKQLALIQSFRSSIRNATIDECKAIVEMNIHVQNLSDSSYNELISELDQLREVSNG